MTNEETIAIIQNEYKCVDRDCDIERSCGKCDLMMPSKEPILEAYKLAIKALEQTTWIPVSERLPNDKDYVLVCYEDGHIRTAYYYIDTNIYPSEFEDCCETGWYNYNEDFMYEQDVIAWQPLPEPYQKGGK